MPVVGLINTLDSSEYTKSYTPIQNQFIALCETSTGNSPVSSLRAVQFGWKVNKLIQGMVDSRIDIKVSPIDNNPDYTSLYPSGCRCDCIVYNSSEHVIAFVELKDRVDPAGRDLEGIASLCVTVNALSTINEDDREEWLPKAVTQLRETIQRFSDSDMVEYATRKSLHVAYVSNRKMGFDSSYACENLRAIFKAQTGFTLYVKTMIKIDSPITTPVQELMTDEMLSEVTA